MDWTSQMTSFKNAVLAFLPNLAGAVIIVVVGLWLVNKLIIVFSRLMARASLGPELTGFLNSIISITLKFIVILFAAAILGFQVSAVVGILAGVVFAIGLALQGFLGNFASGITIVFFKPYKVGDWVQIADYFGKVESIQIFNTTLVTPGDKVLIIPNGKVTDEIITNFSTKGHSRLEIRVTMPYAESFPRVRKIIEESLHGYPHILENPAPVIGIESFDTHNIIVTVRPYILPDHYWQATFDIHQRIKEAFYKSGIKVAYSEGVELGNIGE